MNIKQIVVVVEATVLSAVAAFLGSVSQLSGSTFDGKHLAAAGVGALIALAYKMSAVLNQVVAAVQPPAAAAAPAAPVPTPPTPTPQTAAPQPPTAG